MVPPRGGPEGPPRLGGSGCDWLLAPTSLGEFHLAYLASGDLECILRGDLAIGSTSILGAPNDHPDRVVLDAERDDLRDVRIACLQRLQHRGLRRRLLGRAALARHLSISVGVVGQCFCPYRKIIQTGPPHKYYEACRLDTCVRSSEYSQAGQAVRIEASQGGCSVKLF